MASVCHWCFVNWDLGSLFRLVITTGVMRPCKQKECHCESDAGRGKDPRLEPATLYRGSFIDAGADARQKRSRRVRVCGDVKPGIGGGKERLLLFECRTAISATGEVHPQFTLWLGTTGGDFDQRVSIMFAWHRNFSANCLRA